MIYNWIEEANKEQKTESEIHSFDSYMEIFSKDPLAETRPTYQYLQDMLASFGKDENGHYKLFQQEHPESPAVFGQFRVQESLISNILNFEEEGFNNKFILLVGPNGSSKSSIVRKFICGAEEYSRDPEGALYTFSWIFPIDQYTKGQLGLSSQAGSLELQSYAHLEDKDITAILTSELKDHPLLLVPRKHRQKLIEEALKDEPKRLQSIKKSYLYKGDLSKRNNMIYNALLKSYKGQHQEVLKHIRVERFTISKRYSNAATTIEPQIHVDAKVQQITMDKRLASLPPSLQSLNLFSTQGEIIMANRGILEYSDLLKRPLDTYKYLLMTMETGSINLQGILTQLDIFFVGTSNEIHLAAFKQHPDFNSFKGRINFIRVPYLLNYLEEEKIYKKQVTDLSNKSYFGPHALKALCLFAVLTRLRPSQSKNYSNTRLAGIISSMNPLEKATFLANGILPARLDSESKQILTQGVTDILREFEGDSLYEGKFGLSPREIKKIIYKISPISKNITFIDILEYLETIITKKESYDFLNIAAQGDYHHPARFIALIKDHIIQIVDREIRSSLGLVDETSYSEHIKTYIQSINALIKGEKIKNTITGKFENPDQYSINEFEKSINLREDPNVFRSHLISKLGAWFLDHPNKEISYQLVFPELVTKLQESFHKEQKKMIDEISANIVFYEAENKKISKEKGTPLSSEGRTQITGIISTMKEKYGHTDEGALAILKFVIKEKY